MDSHHEEENIFFIPPEISEKLQDPAVVIQYLEQGKTLQEILGYTEDKVEEFYQKAKILFERQEYEQAKEGFMFLVTLNPYVHAFWLGLGMAEELCHHFHEALRAYGMAIFTDPTNPLPYYHAATCHQALNDSNHARQSLEFAIETARLSDDKNMRLLEAYAQEALLRLKQK